MVHDKAPEYRHKAYCRRGELSTGETVTDPRHERCDRDRIRRWQKDLSRKTEDSENWDEDQVELAMAHARIADRRRDFLHRCTARLVNENQVVAVEGLNVRGMLADHRPARAIADAPWVEYEAERHGRTLVAVDRFLPSSKTCSACGSMQDTMPLAERVFECAACGHTEDRDVNRTFWRPGRPLPPVETV